MDGLHKHNLSKLKKVCNGGCYPVSYLSSDPPASLRQPSSKIGDYLGKSRVNKAMG